MISQRYLIICLYLILLLVLLGCHSRENTAIRTPPTVTQPVRVLVLAPDRYTYGDGTPVDRLIEGTGAINAADHLTGSQQINDRELLAMNPDVVVFTASWRPSEIARWSEASVYSEVQAIQTQRLYQFNYPLTDARLQLKNQRYTLLLKRLFWPQN